MSMIERPLTPEEKKDTIPLGSVDYTKVFRHRIAEHEKKCLAEKNPFCRRCSYIDFDKQIRMTKIDLEEKGQPSLGTEQALLEVAKNFSFDKYTGKNYYNLVGTSAIEEHFFIDMNKVNRHTANWALFECKPFKHPISMRIELKEWEAWMNKTMSRSEQKEFANPTSANVKVAN